MKPPTTAETRAASRQHLLRLLVEQVERTFTTEGHEGGLRIVTDLLEGLDDDALRAYAYRQGIRSEDEFENEAGAESGPPPTGAA